MNFNEKESVIRNRDQRVVIACRIMEPEITLVRKEQDMRGYAPEIIYLDQLLHRTPGKLLSLIQEKVDQVAPSASQIVLGYALCSNGVVGVQARDSRR